MNYEAALTRLEDMPLPPLRRLANEVVTRYQPEARSQLQQNSGDPRQTLITKVQQVYPSTAADEAALGFMASENIELLLRMRPRLAAGRRRPYAPLIDRDYSIVMLPAASRPAHHPQQNIPRARSSQPQLRLAA